MKSGAACKKKTRYESTTDKKLKQLIPSSNWAASPQPPLFKRPRVGSLGEVLQVADVGEDFGLVARVLAERVAVGSNN